MALKFLNKKGWHTGSLRNIENVWKAEQKHDAEQKKLEELRKQIREERERDEFRLLQERAGVLPYALFSCPSRHRGCQRPVLNRSNWFWVPSFHGFDPSMKGSKFSNLSCASRKQGILSAHLP